MKVVTAIGSPDLNKKLKEIKNYEVIGRDVVYQDGVFELLDIIKDVEILFISNLLPGKYSFEDLIKKIKENYEKTDIIVFLDFFDNNLINFLNANSIYKIYDLKKIDEYLKNLGSNEVSDNERFKNELYMKIENSKKISEKNSIIPENNNKKIEKKILDKIIEEKFVKNNNKAKIITFDGNPGTGKSILSCLAAFRLSEKNSSVLQMSLNKGFSTTNVIFGIEEKNGVYMYKKLHLYNYDVEKSGGLKEGDNIYVYEELYHLYERFRKEYEYIIIDVGNIQNTNVDLLRVTYEYSNMIIYICEPNLINIQKSKNFLEKMTESDLNKTRILINKANTNQIKNNILESVFERNGIIGKIDYSEKFNVLINKNFNKNVDIPGINSLIEKMIH